MKDYEAKALCTKTVWTVAALAGGMLGLGLWLVADYSSAQAIFMAVVAFLLLGVILSVFLCRDPASKDTHANMAANAPAAKAPAPAPVPAPKPAPAPAPVATEPAAAPASAEDKPATMSAAREGGPDDLKQIKGVGPKLENLLHSMGFYHFDQIAGWTAKEVAWVDENLEGFKGRVSRDEWVSQAKVLAEGGTTEFSKKVAKGGVYE